ncbi:MAG: hypothetical protein U0746_02825 [Gemmataceae bacterium]
MAGQQQQDPTQGGRTLLGFVTGVGHALGYGHCLYASKIGSMGVGATFGIHVAIGIWSPFVFVLFFPRVPGQWALLAVAKLSYLLAAAHFIAALIRFQDRDAPPSMHIGDPWIDGRWRCMTAWLCLAAFARSASPALAGWMVFSAAMHALQLGLIDLRDGVAVTRTRDQVMYQRIIAQRLKDRLPEE